MPATSGHPSEDGIEIDAILAKSITLPESIPSISSACITAIALDYPSTTLDYTTNPVRWGNSSGLSLLQKLDDHDAEFHRLRHNLETTKKTLESTKNRVTDLESEMSTMKGEMNTLKQESDAYLAIRNLFFATFRRDILNSVLEKDKTTIPKGNNCALGGDFLVDAKLYEKNYRFDDDVFTRLYGLAWQRAESYRKQPEVVSALNLYAGAIANPLYSPQDLKNLKECFATFIISLQTGGYRKFINFPNYAERHALDALLQAHRNLPKKNTNGPV